MFRLIEVTTYNDGTSTAQGMYPYEDDTVAIANFHTKMGGAMKLAKVETEMVMIITEEGNILKRYNSNDGSYTSFNDYFKRGLPLEPEIPISE